MMSVNVMIEDESVCDVFEFSGMIYGVAVFWVKIREWHAQVIYAPLYQPY